MKAQQITRTIGNKSGEAIMADFWDDFAKRNGPSAPPPNSFNSFDYAEKYNVNEPAAKQMLDRRTKAGELEMVLVRVLRRGRLREMAYYFPRQSANRSGIKRRK